MNLPNKLSLLRVFLVPIVICIYLINPLKDIYMFNTTFITLQNFLMLIIVVLASVTDFLDGHIARKYNLITNLGKFLDPLADKMMTITAFCIILDEGIKNNLNMFTWWMLAVIIIRELMVSGVRMMGASQNKVIAANIFGKAKTCLQFATIWYLLLVSGGNTSMPQALVIIGIVLSYLTVLLTIVSGVIYLVQNKSVLKEE